MIYVAHQINPYNDVAASTSMKHLFCLPEEPLADVLLAQDLGEVEQQRT